ncbi:MAG: hypothetical protein EZS28_023274 [Streblomastix strix]|uniref:Ubiquitin-like domain-containing protein n=1 Tax=Streblomastix strix TaxID=222440 RepID=A0A5J4VF13_9EUKA|nr:MAG: hypothetical protein EZS28_023274 [Streblomastix strix]
MQIKAKTISGKTITLDVNNFDTIQSVKQQIQAKEGISANYQELLYAGHPLEDFQTLQSYGIQSETTLNLFMRKEPKQSPTNSRYIDECGKQIMIYKDGYVDRQSKAVYDGNIIINKDGTVSLSSPWVKQGLIRVTNDGKLDKRYEIMQSVIDRSQKLTTKEIRAPYDQTKARNENEQKGNDNTGLEADHQASLYMVTELLKHKPGRRNTDEIIKEQCRSIPFEMIPKIHY